MRQLKFEHIQEELERNFPPEEYSPVLALKTFLGERGIISGIEKSPDSQALMMAFTVFRPELDIVITIEHIKDILSGEDNEGWMRIKENLVQPKEEIEDEEPIEGTLGL